MRIPVWFNRLGIFLSRVLLVFVLLNLVFGFGFWLRDRFRLLPGMVARKYGAETIRQAYPGWKPEDLSALLAEQDYASQFVFEPLTVFKSRSMNGRFVNIENGYRRISDQAPWPPNSKEIAVFVFGGSTAFGFGLPDNQTIPSDLQRDLRAATNGSNICVYNFGRIGYISTQEVALFTQLIREGRIPRVAVFMDGMNEFSVEELMNQARPAGIWIPVLHSLPLSRFLEHYVKQWIPAPEDSSSPDAIAQKRIGRWLANKAIIESIAERFGVAPVFVWQPVPIYKYDMKLHLFAKGFSEETADRKTEIEAMKKGYALLEGQKQQPGTNKHLLWLAGLQEHISSNG